jgi:peroxiredoxin Q/BCP
MAKAKKKTKKVKKAKAAPKAKKAAGKAKAKKAPAKKAAKKAPKAKAKAKPAKKKAAAKKAAPKKAPAKKSAAPKAAPQKAAPKKSAPKKASAPKASPSLLSAPVSAAASDHDLLGQGVPALLLPNQHGETVDLAAVVESNPKVVLYFYPKDDTPGCTKEACDFRDNMNRVMESGIKIFGVSPDDADSHRKFIDKYGLNFDLLTDTDHQLADALSVWKEKSFMGKTFMGVERATFLFNNGRIAKVWQPVKVEGHVDDVLSTAAEL